MAFDDGLVEVLDRNHDLLSAKRVLICGNITSLSILSQVKDLSRAYLLLDNYDTAQALATMVGMKLGASEFERADKKHLSLICAAPYDSRTLEAIDSPVDVFVLMLNKVKSLNQTYLHALSEKITHDTKILLLGANALGGKSADSLIKDVANVVKIDSARKCSLYQGTLKPECTSADIKAPKALAAVSYGGLNMAQNHGLFSQGELDLGTKLLLDAVHADLSGIEESNLRDASLDSLPSLSGLTNVLDLGCGSGIIGLSLAKRGASNVVCSDISPVALYTTKHNAKELGLEIHTLACNMLPSAKDLDQIGVSIAGGKFNMIVTNPPFHDGSQRTLAPTLHMIAKAKDSLVKGGVLYLVGNNCLHYEDELNQHFEQVEYLVKTTKFTVFKAINA